MLFKTRSAAVYGIEAYLVDVEVNLTTGGNGQTVIVGLPDTAVRESKNRVLPAIRNNGYGAPYQKIVINLGPADVKKEGSAFDLPMAIGILDRIVGKARPAVAKFWQSSIPFIPGIQTSNNRHASSAGTSLASNSSAL